jgi:UPF0042 nucleotide-binding protein
MRLVVISGLSGAGKGVALHALEDSGYHCVDNLPLSLLPDLAAALEPSASPQLQQVAVVIDARNLTARFEDFERVMSDARARGLEPEVVYLGAHAEVLVKRFSETRRRHPLTVGDVSLEEAIRREEVLLEPIRQAADVYIDTTRTQMHELRDLVRRRIGSRVATTLSLLLESFGFKHGVPSDADMVFDARFLPNPYWEPALRTLDGRDEPVQAYLDAQPKVREMLESLSAFLDRWVPEYNADNRAYLTVAVGCTGGRHRSVYLVERLAAHFGAGRGGVMIRHREL